MPFNDEHRRRKGVANSREFWIGVAAVLGALLIGLRAFDVFRSWFG